MKKIVAIVFVLGSLALRVQAQGPFTYLSSFSQSSAGSRAVGSDSWLAATFTSGTNPGGYLLNSVQLGLADAITALAFASIGMIVTPGGIGAYAYFIAMVLEKSDIPFEIGYANGTLQWFAQFLIVVIVGFICLGLLPWYNKKKVGSRVSEVGS